VLAEVAQHALRPQCVVGFAAETQDIEKYALDKLQRKRLDLIAANDVIATGQGFESDHNALSVFSLTGRVEITKNTKLHVAGELLTAIANFLESKA
jgi:phosphopantothenoylcysteine decarboxylase / phosphopantothenate---cysteine ligase